MAIVEAFTGTETVGATEWDLTTDTAGPDADTADGVYQFRIELNNLAAGDIFEFRAYEKVTSGATQRLAWAAYFSDAQAEPLWVSPEFTWIHGGTGTMRRLAGTDRAITWSILNLDTAYADIATRVWSESLPGSFAADTAGERLATTDDRVDAAVTTRASVAALATVQADTDDIQTRLPASLNDGRMRSHVEAMSNDTITAAVVATDAIDADALAADAVTEIQAGLATSAALATVQSDTDDIQARLPATLSGGLMRSRVESMDANTLTASALANDAVDKIVDGTMDEVYEGTRTFRQWLRLAASRLWGKATVPPGDGSYAYRDAADTKNRIVGEIAGSARTINTVDES